MSPELLVKKVSWDTRYEQLLAFIKVGGMALRVYWQVGAR